MKKFALLPALLLLLAACGSRPAPTLPSATPETPQPVVVTSEPVESQVPQLSLLDLPAPGDLPKELDGGTRVAFLKQAETADIALYSVLLPGQDIPNLLIRYVDKLQFMDTVDVGITAPYVVFTDFDGDGENELAVVLQRDSASTLTLYEWDEGWTAIPYTAQDFSGELLNSLDFDQTGGKVVVTYGNTSATYTPGPADQSAVRFHKDFSDQVVFRVEDSGIYTVFGLGADVGGQVRYFATLTATVSYQDGNFGLYDLRLISNSGV